MASPLWKLLSLAAEHPLLNFMKTNVQSDELGLKYIHGWKVQIISGKLDLEVSTPPVPCSKIFFLIKHEISCISVDVHYLWAPLGKFWLCLLSSGPAGIDKDKVPWPSVLQAGQPQLS